jgi:hypothetical protein
MALPSTAELIDSLKHYDNIIAWLNDTLQTFDGNPPSQPTAELNDLDQQITNLLATLDIASEDTSTQVEQIIDDVSRSIPRLTYDLHFLKDNAVSLQAALTKIQQTSKDVVPQDTTDALNSLRLLDTAKGRMESAREVLREAESWGSLELEVTSLLAERNYGKAAERLSEANRSMIVFQNTPDYEPRRTLMVSLQNQLEASLSSALVSAINAQDIAACRNYFSIFSRIQRESEFRNYYNASRRVSVVTIWNNASILDCDSSSSSTEGTSPQTFIDFLSTFYANFLSLLNTERVSIPAIFPDPAITLSGFIISTLSSLQPTFSQRLSSLVVHHGDAALPALISLLRTTEEFAVGVEKVIEKLKYAAPAPSNSDAEATQFLNPRSHSRRRSTRMSISLRPGNTASPNAPYTSSLSLEDGLEWDQELFKPFLDFQVDYGTFERRFLGHAFQEIVSHAPREKDTDRARLLKERAIDVFAAAEESLTRCTLFTHGYGAVGLVQALDNFFQSFVDIWTADVRLATTSQPLSSISDDDLFDMDYSAQDWSDFQLSVHLLSSARAVYDRVSAFETKLRSNLIQTATRFRLARKDTIPSAIAPSRGENQLLEQSSLNSSDLHALLTGVESETHSRDSFVTLASTAALRQNAAPFSEPLLVESRRAVFAFASTCQQSLQKTISSPLRKHLVSYASSTMWTAPGDPKSKRITTTNELQLPMFSLSPSDIVQRVAEGLLNLPRLFEVYADDDALAFSLHTLPYGNVEVSTVLSDQTPSAQIQPTHMRRPSLSTVKPTPTDPDAVSSAWLSSLGHTLLEHITTDILPSIASLSLAGAAQLASDLEYLSNIVRVLNVEYPELDKWKEYCEMDNEEGKRKFVEEGSIDRVLQHVGRLRGWNLV